MHSEPLLRAVERYLKAPTLHEARHVLETSPELVGPEAPALSVDAILIEMEQRCGGLKEVVERIRERASLLSRARHLGIEEAFRDLSGVSQEREAERLSEERFEALERVARILDPRGWASVHADAGNRLLTSTAGVPADNVEAAIRHYDAALQVRTRDGMPREWAATMHNLGRAFSRRVYGDPEENAAAAVRSYEAALTVVPPNQAPSEWAETACWLAAAYATRRSRDRAALTRALALLGRVLELGAAAELAKVWEMAMFLLGESCHIAMRDGPTRDAGDVASVYWGAAQLEEIRLRVREGDAASAAARDSALAYIGQLKQDVTRRPEDAVRVYGRGAEVIDPKQAPVARAIVLNHLGIAYDRCTSGRRAENLERAIGAYREALDALDANKQPITWAELQFNLGLAWFQRIRGDRAENMECCIDALKKAAVVNLRDSRPEHWSDTRHQLGLAHLERILGEKAENLEVAIRLFQEALEVRTSEGSPKRWGIVKDSLCTAYRSRIFGDPVENAKLAVECGEAALTATDRDQMPAEWAKTMLNLALAYAKAAPDGSGSQRSIAALGAALDAVDPGADPGTWGLTAYHLAQAYARLAETDQRGCFGKAVHHYGLAIELFSERGFLAQLHGARQGLADFLFSKRCWRDAEAAYAAAFETAEALLRDAYTDGGRVDRLAAMSRGVPRHAYCFLRLGRPGEAFMRLEQGKGRLLAEALALGDAELVHMPQARRAAVQDLRRAILELEAEMRAPPDKPARRSDRDLAEALRDTRVQLHAMLENNDGGRPSGLTTGLDLPTLLGLVPEGGALVAPVLTPQGSAVFIIPHGTRDVGMEQVLWLPGLTDAKLRELTRGPLDRPAADGWLGAYGYAHIFGRSDTARAHWLETVEDALGRLWRMLMGPVHARLSKLGLRRHAPIVLIPQGELGLLPLHAAHREVRGRRRCVLDDWTVSYAPCGRALLAGSRRLGDAERQGRTLLAVIDPTGDLPFAPIEGDAVAAMFDPTARQLLPGEKATRDNVARGIASHAYLHFSCHGSYSWLEPMRSALLLAGGERLTLADVLGPGFDLGAARLVVFSACETGLTDIRHAPDEFIGLPAGFLQAGAPTVVATLWPVDDVSTSLLVEDFYRRHLGDGLPPATALRAAQLWLRDASAVQLNLAGRWAQVYRRATGPDLTAEAYFRSAYYVAHPEERPFAHPHHWAAFSVVGA